MHIKRYNEAPVFICGFSRGGTNILLNLILSHPSVCVPKGEFNQVLQGKAKECPKHTKFTTCLKDAMFNVQNRYSLFSARNWKKRKPVNERIAGYIDQKLYKDKLLASKEGQNRYKTQNLEYRQEEIENSRVLCKTLDGLIMLCPQLNQIFPDAKFIGIVRNGYALCESHFRRNVKGKWSGIRKIAMHYEKGCQQMILNKDFMPNFKVFRYEDLVQHPFEMLEQVYAFLDLDLAEVDKIRLQKKRVVGATGSYVNQQNMNVREVVWYDKSDFNRHFKKKVNAYQINNLTEKQIETISKVANESLRYFGYLSID